MKVKTIQSGSFIVGLLAAVVSAAIVLLSGSWWWVSAVMFVAVMGVGYFSSLIVMQRYVTYKLKPMYQIVFSKDVKTSDLEDEFESASDIVEKMEDELTQWAETNRLEIKRLKENENFRKEYIGNVSHEIKTPIFNIQGYISTLLDGGLEDPNINRSYLERAEKSIERLINIITDLDEISKLESRLLELQFERFDIIALTKECVEAMEIESARKEISIKLAGRGVNIHQPVFVYADKHYISQVLSNLLVNSVRYGMENSRTEVIFIDMFDKIMVEVSDNGIGIAREDIPRIFERFYRTDKGRSREQGGTGLGLSIVKHIIEAHDESLKVRSELGEGSTFSFTVSKGKIS